MAYTFNPFTGKFDTVYRAASEITIVDIGVYYTGTDVEAALQEIGAGTTLDARYVNATGDTMTGALTVQNLKLDTNTLSSTSGAVTLTPLAGQNLNVNLSTTGDLAVNTNQLYVDTSTGYVGIGTTSPSQKLHVVGGSAWIGTGASTLKLGNNGIISVRSSDDSNNITLIGNINVKDADDIVIGSTTGGRYNDNIVFRTNGGDKVIIDINGNVGIGTTGPGRRLAVVGDTGVTHVPAIGVYSGSTLVIDLQANNSVYGPLIQFPTGSGGFDMFNYRFFGADGTYGYKWTTRGSGNVSTDRLLISGNADTANVSIINSNVGIGTTSPLGRLHINGTADDQQLIVQAHSTQTANVMEIQDSSGTATVKVTGGSVENTLVVDTTNGRVGVGGVPATTFDVTGNVYGKLVSITQQHLWSGVEWALYVTGYTYLNEFRINGFDGVRALYRTVHGEIGFATLFAAPTSDDKISFSVGNSGIRKMVIDWKGNIGMGIESPTARLHVVGDADTVQNIIKAHSTQTANIVEIQNSSGTVQLAFAGNGRDFVLDTTTGTKIGTATNQKLGFFNATPVVQQATIVDADGTLADMTTKFNTLLAQLEALGLNANA